MAEHDNPYDPHAVGVFIDGRKVGHLAREDAAAFWPLVERIQTAGRVAYCRADVYGGWNTSPSDRGEYRVTLYASGAAEPGRPACPSARREVESGDRRREAGDPNDATCSGTLRGRHHSAWHAEVDRLRDIGDQSAAVDLLLEIVDATETEARSEGFGVAPAAYETLAVIYRQRKDKDGEVAGSFEQFARRERRLGLRRRSCSNASLASTPELRAPASVPKPLGQRLQRRIEPTGFVSQEARDTDVVVGMR